MAASQRLKLGLPVSVLLLKYYARYCPFEQVNVPTVTATLALAEPPRPSVAVTVAL